MQISVIRDFLTDTKELLLNTTTHLMDILLCMTLNMRFLLKKDTKG